MKPEVGDVVTFTDTRHRVYGTVLREESDGCSFLLRFTDGSEGTHMLIGAGTLDWCVVTWALKWNSDHPFGGNYRGPDEGGGKSLKDVSRFRSRKDALRELRECPWIAGKVKVVRLLRRVY